MKIGLVVEGGGMKCAYSAGILDCFLDDNITFDYCIGVSAGCANTASYLAGQKGRNLRFYTQHIHDPEYFGFRQWLKKGDLFNLHYIYGDLTNSDGKDPLDWPAVLKNPSEFEIAATNAITGKPEYFDKTAIREDDYRIIMASCALPAACRPVVLDNGIPYYDGGASDAIPVQRALDAGCDKVVVLLSKPRTFIKQKEGLRPFYTLLCCRYPNIIRALNERHLMYRRCQDLMFSLEKEGKAFLFFPDEGMDMGTYDMDEAANQALYDIALKHYESRKEALREFLQ